MIQLLPLRQDSNCKGSQLKLVSQQRREREGREDRGRWKKTPDKAVRLPLLLSPHWPCLIYFVLYLYIQFEDKYLSQKKNVWPLISKQLKDWSKGRGSLTSDPWWHLMMQFDDLRGELRRFPGSISVFASGKPVLTDCNAGRVGKWHITNQKKSNHYWHTVLNHVAV